MTPSNIANAIRSRVSSQLVSAFGYVVGYDNQEFIPPESGPWLEASVIFGEGRQVSLGSAGQKRFRTIGLLNVLVFVPVNTGDGAALDIVGNVVSAFRSITTSSVTYQTPNILRIGQVGKYYQIAVQCPFYADTIS